MNRAATARLLHPNPTPPRRQVVPTFRCRCSVPVVPAPGERVPPLCSECRADRVARLMVARREAA
jgi:hypothetical protein